MIRCFTLTYMYITDVLFDELNINLTVILKKKCYYITITIITYAAQYVMLMITLSGGAS